MANYWLKFHTNYILAQLLGWTSYIAVAFLLNQLTGNPLSSNLVIGLSSAFATGLLVSHAYRACILKFNWLKLAPASALWRLLLGCLVAALTFEVVYLFLGELLLGNLTAYDFAGFVQEFVGWLVVFMLWSIIYFAYHYFRNYKTEEIKNLKLEASKAEIELSNLKSQLNPHFIFNAMNTIRALIDENPKIAKDAVTKLSQVLRTSLQSSKRKLVPLAEEIQLVESYLAIEKARYEERLTVHIEVEKQLLQAAFPPLMLQTLCENAIKHGISKLATGGVLHLAVKQVAEAIHIEIINSGKLQPALQAEEDKSTGIGLENTRHRLKLIYGDDAHFSIEQINNIEVKTTLIIDHFKQYHHEN